jgi:formamidase
VFRVETVDWTGGQIKNDDCADDVKHVDLTQVRRCALLVDPD